jgi:hypothetical protein
MKLVTRRGATRRSPTTLAPVNKQKIILINRRNYWLSPKNLSEGVAALFLQVQLAESAIRSLINPIRHLQLRLI